MIPIMLFLKVLALVCFVLAAVPRLAVPKDILMPVGLASLTLAWLLTGP